MKQQQSPNNLLIPIREELEELRIGWLKKIKIGQTLLLVPVLLFILAVLGMFFAPAYYFYFILLMILASILTAFIYLRIINRPQERYKSEFKSHLLKKIVAQLYPNFSYQPNKFISEEEFYACHLFYGKGSDKYVGEDHFEGTIKKVPIRFSEIYAQHVSGKSSAVFFHGLFMILDVQKEFKGNTFVLPHDYERILGQIEATVKEEPQQLTAQQLPYLGEKADFATRFTIFSTQVDEALEVLTPQMLDRFYSIRQDFQSEISVAFQDGYVYIAIPLRHRSLFEADIRQSLTKNNYLLEGIYAELATCFDMINHLPLDHLN